MSLKRLLYSLFLYLIFPLVLLKLLLRSRANPDYRKRWSERLGFIKNTNDESVIWVHAVSVGEVIAAKPLIDELLKTYSHIPILVTTTTPTGSDRVKAMFSGPLSNKRLLHVYFPYDLLGAVSRFVKVVRPRIFIVVETEIWPNLYAKCHHQNIPIMMVNARLSNKSKQSYLKFKGLVAEALAKVNIIAVRSIVDAERFIQLGAKESQIQECGNIKYDINVDQTQENKAKKYLKAWNMDAKDKRPVLVAASTHKGEDSKILFIYVNLLKQFPNLLLVLVPRHPERFDDVYNDCIEQLPESVTVIRHSQSAEYECFKCPGVNEISLILGDSMGEMQMWYATADIVFIGGSLVETGGHNPLEATLFGVPVVSGPHMFNFDDIATELSAAELLYICNDEFEIINKIVFILSEKQRLNQQDSNLCLYQNTAEAFMQQHQGVTARLMTMITKQLD